MAKPTVFIRLLGWCVALLASLGCLGCDSLKPEKPEKPASGELENLTSSPTANPAPSNPTPSNPTPSNAAEGIESESTEANNEKAPADGSVPTTTALIFGNNLPPADDSAQALEFPDDSASPQSVEPNEYQQQLLASLGDLNASLPAEWIQQLQKIDGAIQLLMSASANNLIDEPTFRSTGLKLGQIKQTAARRLVEHPSATAEQRKSGQLAQLIALSHLSGFRDVEAARELEKYAAELSASSDLDLAHQGRVVLMGFQLQSLQNGVSSDPNDLLASAEGLFTRAADRNFPELMILLQSSQVLDQMGFDEAAQRMDAIIVEEFRQASDPKLRNEAWNIETRGSQALENYLIAFRSLSSEAFDSTTAIAAARQLFTEFPSVQTLEQLAGTVVSIEYGGNAALSRQLVDFIDNNLKQFAPSEQTAAILQTLDGSKKRNAIVAQPLTLNGLVGFDGQPFQAADYAGKVVLVDFWASWCTNCLNEIPEIRRVYKELHDSGFEVISVNMDENLKAAQEFVEKRNFPWRSYHAADTDRLGFRSQFAEELGIAAIPFMLLVSVDGQVTELHVRGERLMPSVRALLGKPTSLIPD